MNQEFANEKINKWGVLLLLDVPEEIYFGIDNTYWKIGNKFKGVKLIPPGAHFVYYSLKDEKYQFKLSFFIHISEHKRIYIKTWSSELDQFIDLDEENEKRYLNGVNNFDFDKYLGAYPLEKHASWLDVSNYIDLSTINRLYNFHPKIFQIENEYNSEQTKKQKKSEKFCEIEGNVNFTDIPQRKILHGISGVELTKINFDKTAILTDILMKNFGNDYKLLFGEFQIAFISFLMGESLESFDQWKKIFILLTSCEDIMKNNKKMIMDLIPVIYNQLTQFPKDFFIDTITCDNFMRSCLKNFIEVGSDESIDKNITGRMLKLSNMISKQFDFNCENDDECLEDRPTIVNEEDFIKI